MIYCFGTNSHASFPDEDKETLSCFFLWSCWLRRLLIPPRTINHAFFALTFSTDSLTHLILFFVLHTSTHTHTHAHAHTRRTNTHTHTSKAQPISGQLYRIPFGSKAHIGRPKYQYPVPEPDLTSTPFERTPRESYSLLAQKKPVSQPSLPRSQGDTQGETKILSWHSRALRIVTYWHF